MALERDVLIALYCPEAVQGLGINALGVVFLYVTWAMARLNMIASVKLMKRMIGGRWY
jgi:hypothetical protein